MDAEGPALGGMHVEASDPDVPIELVPTYSRYQRCRASDSKEPTGRRG